MRCSIRASGIEERVITLQTPDTVVVEEPPFATRMFRMLLADKFALCAAIFLLVIILIALIGPSWLGDLATKQNLRGRNAAPFDWQRGWVWWMGADALGRPLLARIIVATQNTMMVAAGAVVLSAVIGTVLGLVAGFSSARVNQVIMRLADVIMSFPSLLIAVIVLYILGSSILNLMLVLAITRIPVYLRTTRAEVLEIRERMFVQAARVMGASSKRILFRHILPVVLPTLTTLATLDFAYRHPAAGNHLGPDDLARPAVSHQCLVAVLLAGPCDHPHHHVAEPAVELAAHRARSGAALAPRNEGSQEWLTISWKSAISRSSSTPPWAW